MHVTWALLSTDRGGQTWIRVLEGRKETKAGTLQLQGSPETQGVTSQHWGWGGRGACDLGKSCGHIYQEVYQSPLTSPAPIVTSHLGHVCQPNMLYNLCAYTSHHL